jgi:hypothetical protein
MYTHLNIITSATVRARVAYCLAITESVFCVVGKGDGGYDFARESLELCWSWLAGQEMESYDLYWYIGHDDDQKGVGGVSITTISVKDPLKRCAWETATSLLLYLAWHLFKLEGATSFPQELEGASEIMVDELLAFARKNPNFQETQFGPLKKYLLENYPATNPDDLGTPISKDEILRWITVQNVS